MSLQLEDHPRLMREYRTVATMIRIYCTHHHGGPLCCDECHDLENFCRRRLIRCVYGADKPTCARCPVHCYKPAQQQKVRDIMRWAGPRMILHHPIMAVRHLIEDRQPLPENPIKARKKKAG